MIRRPPISTLFPYTPLYRSPPAPELPDPRRHLHRRLAAAVRPRGDAQGRARPGPPDAARRDDGRAGDRKSTRLNSSHSQISYAVFCLKKNTTTERTAITAPD